MGSTFLENGTEEDRSAALTAVATANTARTRGFIDAPPCRLLYTRATVRGRPLAGLVLLSPAGRLQPKRMGSFRRPVRPSTMFMRAPRHLQAVRPVPAWCSRTTAPK